ncbi:aminotransferase class I/II-fold pyridoxal phosphate-dependent enzyme [Acetonema longum]|uniref:Aluminum resistance protein n=1 Tax=Acetonema longum DSM 6540 TaxID=1009370 RepID=F7NPC4_9FIRM|nr:methionine gamma-lyase family protein [Acetonema longum]EGO62086.1 aluminum resistance protein [Acetonema longum DSM 6540]
MIQFPDTILQAKNTALEQVKEQFLLVDSIALNNTSKVLSAFQHHRVSPYHFGGTTGYGYDDAGRDTLDAIWSEICQTEKAIFRPQFVSGTHALATVLLGILRTGDELLAITGSPYDTLQTVIGYPQSTRGSLIDRGICYDEIALQDGKPDLPRIAAAIRPTTKMAMIQRSRGYSMRSALTIEQIKQLCATVKSINPACICFVDNCYGEFVAESEPTQAGADIMAGSLIKNPGGGLAPTGGYVAGREDLVDLAAYQLTAPGIGAEVGCSLDVKRLMYQGLFLAPHTVAQAVKSAIFAAQFFTLLGYKTHPAATERRNDIIQAVQLGSPEKMVAFCRGLQHHSPVDSHVSPEPSGMPGYSDAVIMAGGTFVQGSSIELSADGPLREPYAVYLQGALSFEHAMLGIMGAAAKMAAAED